MKFLIGVLNGVFNNEDYLRIINESDYFYKKDGNSYSSVEISCQK